MRYLFLTITILLLLPALLCAQEYQFTQEYDSIQVEMEEYILPAAWTGGYAKSCPELTDIDGDSDCDLFLGQQLGTISMWENTGNSNSCSFQYITDEYQSLYAGMPTFSRPEFWDIDGDGDSDLFIANWIDPLIAVYENTGNILMPVFDLMEDTLKDINGDRIYCQRAAIIDLDSDGDNDLLCGEYGGFLYYYENIGNSSEYQYTHIGGNFENIDVGESASPVFIDINADNDFDLFIGNKYGYISYYENIGDSINYDFSLVSSNWLDIDVGDYASPEFCDIDGDGDYDLFIGKDNDLTYDIPGAVHYWENIGTPQSPQFTEITQSYLTFDAGNTIEPHLCDIDLDDDLDLFFMHNSSVGWLENIGDIMNPTFVLQSYDIVGSIPSGSVDLIDLNGDDSPELITSDGWGGTITFWENISQPGQIEFEQAGSLPTPYLINTITFADLDADEDADLLLGGAQTYPSNPRLVYYQNQGTSQVPNFVMISEDWQNISTLMSGYAPSIIPYLCDVDMDTDFDLLMLNLSSNALFLFENQGTPQQAQMSLINQNFLGVEMPNEPFVDCGDIDDDGDVDVFGGKYQGGMIFFRNTTGDTSAVNPPLIQHPRHGIEMTFGPNPANPVGVASFELRVSSFVNLGVYDICGRLVKPLASEFLLPGSHQFRWNIENAASGVYLLRLQANNATLTKKVIVLK